MSRFTIPVPGPPSAVRFPAFERRVLDNGVGVWAMSHTAVPVVTIAVLLDVGASADPSETPGLASLTNSLMGEGAGDHDAIGMADALARIGSHVESDTGPDASSLSLTAPVKYVDTAMRLLSDVSQRPRMAASDFERVRDLRLSRLKQLRLSPSSAADRALLTAAFGAHPYGHGALGTTRSVSGVAVDSVREFWSNAWSPERTTVIVSGDLTTAAAHEAVERYFGDWTAGAGSVASTPPVVPSHVPTLFVVDRPGASQSELRVGQTGPGRHTPHYHALVALNAILGGLFTSRINRNLRESRAITYGARTSLDFRRAGGLIGCDTSVQADASAIGASEILREIRGVMHEGAITPEELAQAQNSITRGYVRQFETPLQLARGMVTLASYRLPDDTFDRFVPGIEQLGLDDLTRAAQEILRPDDSVIVCVGDLSRQRESLASLGRPIVEVAPEF
jgi:zinc protease